MRTGAAASVMLVVLVAPLPLVAQTEGTAAWTYAMSSLADDKSPAIGEDGTIYAVDRILHAISSEGQRRWTYTAGPGVAVTTSPCLGRDGTIYVGTSAPSVHAVTPDGTLKWSFSTGGYKVREPAVSPDGTIYVWSEDDSLYALDALGNRAWATAIPGGRSAAAGAGSSPIVGGDGTVYLAAVGTALFAFDKDGSALWTYDVGSWSRFPPALGADGTIYLALGTAVHALNPDGTAMWSYQMGGGAAVPAIGPDGTVYAGSSDRKLYAIDPNGSVIWTYETDGLILAGPAVGADGTIYVGSGDDRLHAVGSDGVAKWTYAAGGDVWSWPAVGADGTVYIVSDDGLLHAVHSASPGLAPSSWPKWRQNNQNSGAAPGIVATIPDSVEFAWLERGAFLTLPLHVGNGTNVDLEIETFACGHTAFSLAEALPIHVPAGETVKLTVEVRADTTGLYTCPFELGVNTEGASRTVSGSARVGLFLDDGSERAETARRALEAFEEARAIDRNSIAAENNRGVLYRLLGSFDDAASHLSNALDSALETGDSYSGIMMNLGVVGSDEGEPGAAASLYEAALEGIALPAASALAPEIFYNEAWEAYRAGNLAVARDRIDAAVTHEMANSRLLAKALVLRGAILAEEGDPLGSRLDFESALALDPEGPIGRMAEENLVVLDAAEEADPREGLPVRLSLSGTYPNPFRSETRIGVVLPDPCPVTLAVYDALGKRVRMLHDGPLPSGASWMGWDARDDAGRPTASGVYLLELKAGAFVDTRKIILLR